jgi:hypothetical protein
MRYGLVLGVAAAGLWAAQVFAQDCCAGSKVDGGRFKEERGGSLETGAWLQVSAPPAIVAATKPDISVPAGTAPR